MELDSFSVTQARKHQPLQFPDELIPTSVLLETEERLTCCFYCLGSHALGKSTHTHTHKPYKHTKAHWEHLWRLICLIRGQQSWLPEISSWNQRQRRQTSPNLHQTCETKMNSHSSCRWRSASCAFTSRWITARTAGLVTLEQHIFTHKQERGKRGMWLGKTFSNVSSLQEMRMQSADSDVH